MIPNKEGSHMAADAIDPSPVERFEIARFGIFADEVLGPLDFGVDEVAS